jgi:hypothetical protein
MEKAPIDIGNPDLWAPPPLRASHDPAPLQIKRCSMTGMLPEDPDDADSGR